MADLDIRLFGGLQILCGGVPLAAFISNKAPALLAYLAMARRPVQRDTLAALFWGEQGEADAKNNLRQVLTNLRKLLDVHLEITRDTVAMRGNPPYGLDVDEFGRGIKAVTGEDQAARVARLAVAVALYHGDFLEGVILRDAPGFEDWVMGQRGRFRELALNAMHDLVDLQMAEGDFAAAIDSATRLLALDPWREETHRQLMLALARTGRRSAALAAYTRCRGIMREVFDAEPADETTELAAQIKASLHGVRHNLVAAANEFVGRTEEVLTLRRLLANPTVRLVTVTGPGGVGKTRLAQHVAQERMDYHLGGVWFVSLVAVADAAGVLPAIAEALHIPVAGTDSPLNQIVNYLRSRDALLILDDFESVLAPASVDAIVQMLAGATHLCIVVTSRERLQMHAEHVLEVGGLAYPADEDDPDARQFAAVQLFIQRARQQHSGFDLTRQNQLAIVRICQIVDGMPLALELAAAWTRSLAPHEILGQIEQGIDILTTTLRDGLPRHRSMRAVCVASWQLLTSPEQRVFAGVAIFRGGFDAAAARAVADATPALLASLVDKSFLRRLPDGRYRVHPLLLQFGEEQLRGEPERLADAVRRHVTYYAEVLAAADPALHGAGQVEALARIGQEMDNVRQAWRLAGEQRTFGFFAAAVDPLMMVFDIAGSPYAARDHCARAHERLAAAPEPSTPCERITLARVVALEGSFEFRLGNFERARDLAAGAVQVLCAEDAAAWNLGHAYTFLGGAYFGLGELPATLVEFHNALDAYTRAGSAWGIATGLGNIGEIHLVLGDEAVALDFAQRAQVFAESTGNAYLLTHNTYRLAVLLANAGDYAAARRYQQQSLAYAKQLGYQSGVGMATASLGDIAFAMGDYVAAEEHFAAAVALQSAAGNWMDEARYLVRQGETALAQGQVEECRSALHAALRKAGQAGAVAVQMDALVQVARLRLKQQRMGEAVDLLRTVAGHAASPVAARTLAERLLAGQESLTASKGATKPSAFALAAVLASL